MTTEYNIEKLKQLLAIEVFKERYYNKIFDLLNTQLQLISAPLAAAEQPSSPSSSSPSSQPSSQPSPPPPAAAEQPPPLAAPEQPPPPPSPPLAALEQPPPLAAPEQPPPPSSQPPLPGTAPSSSPPLAAPEQPSSQPSSPSSSSPSSSAPPPQPSSPPSPPPPAAAEQAAESKENNVNVIFVRVKFDEHGKKYITNQDYNIDFGLLFNDLTIEDLYKSDKSDKYVKYHTNNNIKYIICIEPDFTENNDDTLKLVNDLYNILTIIYSSIIKTFIALQKKNKKLKLILSVPSINDSDVSIINKKTILGCFSKIYKQKYRTYKIDFGDENIELEIYFRQLE